MDNLWNIKTGAITQNPIAILQEQANILLKETHNKVGATVTKSSDMFGDFVITFLITSPTIPNYSFKVFSAKLKPTIYPIIIDCDENIQMELGYADNQITTNITCHNYDEFLNILSRILGSNYIGQVLQSLMMLSSNLSF